LNGLPTRWINSNAHWIIFSLLLEQKLNGVNLMPHGQQGSQKIGNGLEC
jgi:hypothetical protein